MRAAPRYTSDGALAECPCCGSLDVGGAHDTVHCYGCGLTVSKPRPLENAIEAWNRRPAIAPPVAAGSVDTLQRFELVESQHGTGYMVHWDKAMEEDADGEWVKHADAIAWGAQQREAGKSEQTAFLKECMDRGQDEFNRKWTEQKERAEKAEDRVKELQALLERSGYLD